jgi:hypothetical protein
VMIRSKSKRMLKKTNKVEDDVVYFFAKTHR